MGIVASLSHAAQQGLEVNKDRIDEDTKFVAGVSPKIRDKFKAEGVADDQIRALLDTAWRDYLSAKPNAVVDPDKFVQFVTDGYGFLSITTEPSGADIWVDGKQWEGETNQISGTKVGKRSVKVRKAGYEEETDTLEVRPGRLCEFYKKLKKE
jgi:hypothetical protein